MNSKIESHTKDFYKDSNQLKEKELLYIVENIIDKKKEKDQIFYKVKWEGYPVEESTWEPAENLKDFINEIKEFENKIKLNGKKRSKSNKNGIGINTMLENNQILHKVDNSDGITHGHYKYRDRSNKILSSRIHNGEILMMVEWLRRPDGIKPLATVFTNEELKQLDPFLLIDYYEKKIYNISKNEDKS